VYARPIYSYWVPAVSYRLCQTHFHFFSPPSRRSPLLSSPLLSLDAPFCPFFWRAASRRFLALFLVPGSPVLPLVRSTSQVFGFLPATVITVRQEAPAQFGLLLQYKVNCPCRPFGMFLSVIRAHFNARSCPPLSPPRVH